MTSSTIGAAAAPEPASGEATGRRGAARTPPCAGRPGADPGERPVHGGARLLILLLGAVWAQSPVHAAPGSKPLATAALSQFEGAAGGGLVPWALIAGYGSREEVDATAFASRIDTGRYRLDVAGVAVGIHDRLELSHARQRLDTDPQLTAALQSALAERFGDAAPLLGADTRLTLDVVGAKLRLAGDAIGDQDSPWPQWTLGAQYKRLRRPDPGPGRIDLPALAGAEDRSGVDLYLQASKLFLGRPGGRNLLLSAGLRASRAHAFGLLGFGRQRSDPFGAPRFSGGSALALRAEAGAVLFLRPDLAIGVELRQRGNRLAGQDFIDALGRGDVLAERTAWDLLAVWLPSKRLAVSAAWIDLGGLPLQRSAHGAYLSLQVTL